MLQKVNFVIYLEEFGKKARTCAKLEMFQTYLGNIWKIADFKRNL